MKLLFGPPPKASCTLTKKSMMIAVLDAGMAGKAIALDLAKDYPVTRIDINTTNLGGEKKTPGLYPG